MNRPASTEPNPVDHYATEVVSGRIPAGKYHRLSCERHLTDRAREHTAGFPYRFEIEKAERLFKFAGRLKHYKGKQFAGRPITLTPVQQFRLGSIFGWRHAETGLRRFTTAYNELPRKSGKTLEAAVIAVYVTFFEGEPGAEGYCIATKRQQSRLVFDACRQLVKSSGLADRIRVFAHNLHRESAQQKLEPLGADGDTTDGLNPYLIITDEFHAMKTRGLIDVMESATGARLSFLHFQITTAGNDPVSPCGDQHDYACKILDGVLEDDESTLAFFAFIAHADPEDDWLDERTWQKANPQWGISVNPEDMRKLAAKAKNMPAAAAEFKQKRLNLWVNTHQPCLSVDGWRQGQSEWDPEELKGQPCFVGIDLGLKIDLCSMSFVFPPTADRPRFRLLQYIWTPEDTLKDRAHRDRAPYDVWVDQGWLLTHPGTRVDPSILREVLKRERERFTIEAIAYDAWQIDTLYRELVQDDGFDERRLVEVPQTFQGMSSAEARFKGEVLAGNVDARRCPVTAWAVSNVIEQTDGKGNIFFTKKKSRGRIDPVKSATIGLQPWLRESVARPAELQIFVFGGR